MTIFVKPRAVARLGIAALVVLIEAAAVVGPATLVQAQTPPAVQPNLTCNDTGPSDYAVSGGWFYTEGSLGCVTGRGPDRRTGFTVVDDDRANFWTGYRRYGDFAVLGYPVSQPYQRPAPDDGRWYQVFQRGILESPATTPPGEAHMAAAFDMFTAANLEPYLEFMGLAVPGPAKPALSFAADAERRMSWLVEPRFLSRYFFDPVAFHSSEPNRAGNTPFATQEQAWDFFGLPQSMADRMLLREKPGGADLWPLMHSFIGQRFSNSGLQLFIEDVSRPAERVDVSVTGSAVLFDPTVVPGDAKNGCVVLTAVGLLARRIATGTIIPKEAVVEQPHFETAPVPGLTAHVPVIQPGQQRNTFELDGANFDANESVDIVLTLKSTTSNTPYTDSKVALVQSDGSFQSVITEDVAAYRIVVTGRTSKKTVTVLLDLSVPTTDLLASTVGTCRDIGLAIGS